MNRLSVFFHNGTWKRRLRARLAQAKVQVLSCLEHILTKRSHYCWLSTTVQPLLRNFIHHYHLRWWWRYDIDRDQQWFCNWTIIITILINSTQMGSFFFPCHRWRKIYRLVTWKQGAEQCSCGRYELYRTKLPRALDGCVAPPSTHSFVISQNKWNTSSKQKFTLR